MIDSKLGKLIVSGRGTDARNETADYAVAIIISVTIFVVVFIIIGILSDYHSLGFGRGTVYGIRIGDTVARASNTRGLAALLLAGITVWAIVESRTRFRTYIDVYEKGVRGLSKKNEQFLLRYNEISSVHTQDEQKWKSVNINAHGKVFQVYTIKCKDIAEEINKRRTAQA
jgi:hypothetical protein